MDVNGSRHWGLHGPEHWPQDADAADSVAVQWQRCPRSRRAGSRFGTLRLRSGLPPGTLVPLARSRAAISAALDAQGALLWWNTEHLLSVGAALRGPDGRLHTPDPVRVALPAGITRINAMALGDDGVLYLATGEALWLVDRRGRALPQQLPTPGFAATVLAARPGAGVWALDGERGLLARTEGSPWPLIGVADDSDDDARFHPREPHPDPARLIRLDARLRPDDRGVALAVREDGLLALLVQRRNPALARGEAPAALHLLGPGQRLTPGFDLGGGWGPFTLAWRDERTLVLAGHAALRDDAGAEQRNGEADTVALHYDLDPDVAQAVLEGQDDEPPRLEPAGDYLPLPGHDGGPLLAPPPQARQTLATRADHGSEDGTALPPQARHAARRHAAVAYVRRQGQMMVSTPAGPAAVPRLAVRALTVVPRPQCVLRGWRANALPGWAAPDSDPMLAPSVIDSHDSRTTWGRLWVEADLPPGCAAVVWLAATEVRPPALPGTDDAFFGTLEVGDAPAVPPDEAGSSANASAQWWPHLLGDPAALPPKLAAWPGLPRAAWQQEPTEVLAGQPRLAPDAHGMPGGRRGLFEVLIQRAGLAVRSLQGRRLWVAVELFGNGRDTPALAALRATGTRFSYRDQYLPGLYGEALQRPASEQPARATGADFLERLLAAFEGKLTRIEGAIADAHRLSQPEGCPPEYLSWLGRWLGIVFEPGLPDARRRAMLRALPALWRLHGSTRGLELALELATGGVFEPGRAELLYGGAVSGGEAVVVENWRMRRSFATILGAELVDRDDPLTAGLVRSGNSVVGDSLLLGDAMRQEFLALYRQITDSRGARRIDPRGQSVGAAQAQARQDLYADLAHRATVLVHQELGAQDLGLMRRVAATQAPAHVAVTVVPASAPFICAVASLVGIDTYLLAGEARRAFTLGSSSVFVRERGSRLGGIDTLGEGATLDARLAAYDFRTALDPQADLRGPASAALGDRVLLDASRSRAAAGRSLVAYRWRLTDRPD